MTTGLMDFHARFACFVLAIATWATLPAFADDPVFSGPQVGETLSGFEVLMVNGEADGTKLDLVARFDGKPTLLIFMHQLTRPGMALTRAVSQYALSQAEHGVKCGIVWLDDDQAAAEAYLRRAAGSLRFVVPTGISVDGEEGPGAYGLNRNVELTILVAKENQVTANFALVQPSLTEAAQIAAEVASLVDQPAPEQKQLEAFAYPNGQMMARGGKQKRAEMQKQDPPNAQTPPDDLRSMMMQLLARDIDQAQANESVAAINTWVGDMPGRKAQLAKMVNAVLERSMGSPLVQPHLKQWQQSLTDEALK